MREEWYQNPTWLAVAGVGIFAAIVLIRNQPTQTQQQAQPTNTVNNPQQNALDGTGQQFVGGMAPWLVTSGNGYQSYDGLVTRPPTQDSLHQQDAFGTGQSGGNIVWAQPYTNLLHPV